MRSIRVQEVLHVLVGFALGVLSGLLTNVVWERRRSLWYRLRGGRDRADEVLGFNAETVGLYALNRWSVARPLTRAGQQVEHVSERPAQQRFEADEWNRMYQQAESEGKAGDICFVSGFSIDNMESSKNSLFRLTLSAATYPEYLATARYLASHPKERSQLARDLDARKFSEIAATSPPSSVKVCVSVVSPQGNVLAIRRSGAVEEKRGVWTLGLNETMRSATSVGPGGRGEDLFDLCERALREEAGLEPYDYGDISISWIGFALDTLQMKVFAQVRSHRPERELLELFDSSHSVYEADSRIWIPLKRETLGAITSAWTPDSMGRTWSDSAPVAAQEVWRMRTLLRSDDR